MTEQIRDNRTIEVGARVTFTDDDAAAFYGLPAGAVGAVKDWLYLPAGDKRWVVVFAVTAPPYTALVRERDLVVLS